MRVIAGLSRGRKLKVLEGLEVRPTTDRIKEAIFSSLQFDIPNSNFLDLFSGSGQMGIEALSRGAKSVTFVDNSFKSVEIIKHNLKETGLFENAIVLKNDSINFLTETSQKYDIVFLDPPYNKGLSQLALDKIENCVSENGLIVCEHKYGEQMPEQVGDFKILKNKKYGLIEITTYKKMEE